MRILVVEDEPRLNELISKKLKTEGYGVDSQLRGDDAMRYIDCTEYDAIVLDIMLPGMNGLDILSKMRTNGNSTPVLLLTARDSIADRVKGLNTGADDYLVKPFSFDELTARVRALVRRNYKVSGNLLTLCDLTVDLEKHRVCRGDAVIELSGKEFAILEYLLINHGIVLSRQKIGDHIWNYDYEGVSNIVDVYIRSLRKKLDEGFERKLIHTVRGAGYVMRDEN